MPHRLLTLALTAAVVLLPCGPGAAEDRLERFREMVGAAQRAGGAVDLPALYAVLDGEILENLRSGAPFAQPRFIQERLDAFGEAWGGGRFTFVPVAGAPGPAALAVYTVAGPAAGGSVRVFGGAPPALLQTLEGPGVPEVDAWPARTRQWLVAWRGAESGRGSQRLRLELWRPGADGRLERAWTLGGDEPLWVSAWSAGGDRIVVRHELRYPGWKPGCPAQATQEERFRPTPDRRRVTLERRVVLDGWHREVSAAAQRLFAALAAGAAGPLAELVPSAPLRRRLPATLAAEDACEEETAPGTVAMAAVERRDDRRVPWSLEWRRAAGGWRLSAARPVLE